MGSKKEKVASDGTAPTFGATVAESTAGTPGKFGYSYSAIDFPLWKVGIGSTDPVNQYIVPNGYCYANACFNDFAEVGTQPTFKGAEKLGELVQGPNMALVEADEACGRANAACAAPPATWNGAPSNIQSNLTIPSYSNHLCCMKQFEQVRHHRSVRHGSIPRQLHRRRNNGCDDEHLHRMIWSRLPMVAKRRSRGRH